MVSTGGTTGSAGGSGFEYGENTVAARLSIDIPTEGVQSLREITQEISRFRTEMEAASRSEGDFIGFFQTLPSIASQASNAYKTFADQLERSLAMQQRLQGAVGQWDVQPGSSPDNFKGMSAGMGRNTQDINQQVAEMDRMREMGQAGERQYLNVNKQRGNVRPGEMPTGNSADDIAQATERISRREQVNQERMGDPTGGGGSGMGGRSGGGGIARDIVNELSSGSGYQGGMLTQMFRKTIDAAQKQSGSNEKNHRSGAIPVPGSGTSGSVGDDDGGMGPGGMGAGFLAKALGIPGSGLIGAAGLGLSAFSAAQYMGPKIQNLKDQGLVEGGGAKEGLGQEVQARIMALNPFLTNDQSRSIIQSALRDGYSGKEYETVTKFMADNIKDFAITAQESRDIIKKQMVEGGGTAEGIAAGLEQQKQLSKGSYLKFPDREKALNGLMNQMSDMGVPFDVASRASAQGLEMFSSSQLLKGFGADVMGSGMSDDPGIQAAQMQLAGIAPSNDMADWGTQLAEAGGAGTEKILKALARQSNGNIGIFRMLVQRFTGQNITVPQARELYKQMTGGKSVAAEADNRIQSQGGAEGSDAIKMRSAGERLNAGVGSAFSFLGGTIADIATGNFSNIPARARSADFFNQTEHIPLLDKLIGGQGGDPNKILVQGADGEWQKLQPKNHDQLAALASGGKWKREGEEGNGRTMREATGDMNNKFGKQNVEVNGAVQIHVSTDPGVKASSSSKQVILTQNQVRANAGYGTATMNNPPPGDR